MSVNLDQLRNLPCNPDCEGRCKYCPREVGERAAAEIERLEKELAATIRVAARIKINLDRAYKRYASK